MSLDAWRTLRSDPEWLAERQSGLGGSEIGAIVGLDPYSSAWDVYRRKVADLTDEEPPSEAATWGTLLEPVVAREWSRRVGVDIEPGTLLRHPERSWHIGTPDYLTREPNRRIVEVKTVGAFSWAREWESGSSIPARVRCQASWYLALTDCSSAVILVLVNGQRLEAFDYARDDVAISTLVAEAETFWREHIEKREPPPPGPDAKPELDALYPAEAATDDIAVLSATDVEKVRDYHKAGELARHWKRQQDEAANYLRERLGKAGVTAAAEPGAPRPLVTWKPASTLDKSRLIASFSPEERERYTRLDVDVELIQAERGANALAPYRMPGGRRLYVRRPDDAF